LTILETRSLPWPDEAACAATAQRLAAHPALRDAFIELHGPLGAGKTTFTRHLLQALGVTGRIKSPTYAVMEQYPLPGAPAISHFDFYRFEDPQEFEDAGFRDVFGAPGLKIAEWPEQAQGLLPVADLRIDIAFDDVDAGEDGGGPRRVRLAAQTLLGVELLS
jgi:tRNA threonylcarbamoyladenosine biosynthesis protein TsaE